MKVIILIGHSGSGKSTFTDNYKVKNLVGECDCGYRVVSADNYFMVNGHYKFNPSKLKEAHASCMREFIDNLTPNWGEDIIVDNTNTQLIEIAPYIAVANAYGVEVEILYFPGKPEFHTIHGVNNNGVRVQKNRIQKMFNEWPPFWPKPITYKY